MPYTEYDFAFILVILELFNYYNEGCKDDDDEWHWRHLNDGDAILEKVALDSASHYNDIPTIRANLLCKYNWFSKYLDTGRSAITLDLKAILQAEMTVENGFVITHEDDIGDQRTYFINGVMAANILKIYGENRNSYGKLHSVNNLPAVIYINGYQEWWRNGKRHRNGGLPAVVYANGDQEWWHNGEWHRDNDLPAIVYANGDQEWWFNGERHRDGIMPAIEYANGEGEWWINGQELVGLPRILTNRIIPLWVNGQRYRKCGPYYRTI